MTKLDEQIVERVRSADVLAFLESRRGFTFTERGSGYRCREHSSLAIKADRLSWYWHSKGMGGYGVLDYLIKIENRAFREAVDTVIGGAALPAPSVRKQEQPKVLRLPQKRGVAVRLYEYLCSKRGIDSNIVNALIQKEMLYEDRRGNIVFVGRDEDGKARFASLRGTHGDCRFRGDCAGSDKRYGFAMVAHSAPERLYVFESPIDAMSHASLANAATGDTGAWKEHCRLSLAGTSDTALPFFLNQHKAIREIVFCLDNDEPGRKASAALAEKYAGESYQTSIELSQGKDFNEDLQVHVRQARADKRTNPLHRRTSAPERNTL